MAMTTGIVEVARFTASAAPDTPVTMMSGRDFTVSAASLSNRSVESLSTAVRAAIVDDDSLTFNPAHLLHGLSELLKGRRWRNQMQHGYTPYVTRLLRFSREWAGQRCQ
jgi:hypothetical protein